MKEIVFVRLDGDNIGEKIELALINSDVEKAQSIHNVVQASIESVKLEIENYGYKILMSGCDDILFSINQSEFDNSTLIKVMECFFERSKFTLSIGVGFSINESLINLRIAKLSGKNKIVYNSSLVTRVNEK